MGQKVSPVGMRVGINRDWNSKWFANDREYAKYLHEDIKIRKYLEKELKEAVVSHVEIERRNSDKGLTINIVAFVARVGAAIGQNNEKRDAVRKQLSKMFKDSNVRFNAVQVENIYLDATLVAKWIARELENRASFRTAQKKAIKEVRRAGAKGCRTLVSGRLGGADIARSEGYKDGIVPLTTLRSNIDFATAEAVTPYGRLGVKVWICKGQDGEEPEPRERREDRRAPRGAR